MRYRFRTLLILVALGPVIICGGCLAYRVIETEIIRRVLPFPMYEPEPDAGKADDPVF